MNNFFILASWSIPFLAQLLALLHYWQRKEYRIDRMLDFFQYDEGKQIIGSLPNTLLILLATIGTITSAASPWAAFLTGVAATIATGYRIKQKGILRPQPTKKIILITLLYVLVAGLIIYSNPLISSSSSIIWQPIIISLIIIAFAIPTKIAKKYYINLAAKKISEHENLTAIGITGSYGKSSTKEFLAHILGSHKKTLKTPANINTDIGVAKFILTNLKPDHQYFVCEMGAYKKGEIAITAQMVKPQIGIITAIASQHLSLFGSLAKIREAKSELVKNLTLDGIAILNYDSPPCLQVADELKTKKSLYSKSGNPQADIKLTKKVKTDTGWQLTITIEQAEFIYELTAIAEPLIENLLPVIQTAKLIKVPESEIAKQLLTLPSTNLKPEKLTSGRTIIDDSYNANPDGIIAAITELSKLPQKNKFIITIGMLELGELAEQEHQRVAENLVENQITGLILKVLPYHYIETYPNIHYTPTATEILSELKKYPAEETAILISNRIPQHLRQQL